MIVLTYINFIFEIFMFVDITFKSKNKNSILEFLKIFKNFSKNEKLQLKRALTFLQNKEYKKVFTVLKSPHVNKTADIPRIKYTSKLPFFINSYFSKK